ncbi:hypothetical protein AB1Y20_018037 [Prymnesium parvum]|uniref:Uncharacterized protein n=1 Tax=Prymnesium parvum TaxID=97485 RepID=A0AB34JP72_PRYPA
MRRTAMLLLVQLVLSSLTSAAAKEHCSSGLKGDFAFKTCASFCKSARAASHCKFCKCQECGFCSGKAPSSPEAHPQSLAPPQAAQLAHSAPPPAASAGGWLLPSSICVALLLGFICYALAASRPKGGISIGEADSPEEELLPYECVKAQSASPGDAVGAYETRALCVGFLCLQYAAYALLRRYAAGILHEEWSFASVLGVGEVIKFGISLTVIARTRDASEAPPGTLQDRTKWLLLNSGKMAVPAAIYLAMNMLGFVSLKRVDAGTFAVVQQSKIFFTALFARIFLSRVLSIPKWCALSCLVCGVTIISLHANPEYACFTSSAPPKPGTMVEGGPFQYLFGVAAVTLDSALSGFATIYFEKVLKTTTLTVWDRNLQLAFWSMVVYLPWTLIDHPLNPFFGWSVVTLIVAALGAVGGILVALVIKHADGLAKNMATASSIVVTTALSHFLFDAPMSSSIVLGSLIVIISGFNYQSVP